MVKCFSRLVAPRLAPSTCPHLKPFHPRPLVAGDNAAGDNNQQVIYHLLIIITYYNLAGDINQQVIMQQVMHLQMWSSALAPSCRLAPVHIHTFPFMPAHTHVHSRLILYLKHFLHFSIACFSSCIGPSHSRPELLQAVNIYHTQCNRSASSD